MLSQTALDADVLARDFGRVLVIGSARTAEVRIALADSQEAGALLRVASGFAAAAREPILTIRAALAELLAKVLRHDALAVGVARLSGMIARSEVVHVIGRRVFFQLDLGQCTDQRRSFFFFFRGGVASCTSSWAGRLAASF